MRFRLSKSNFELLRENIVTSHTLYEKYKGYPHIEIDRFETYRRLDSDADFFRAVHAKKRIVAIKHAAIRAIEDNEALHVDKNDRKLFDVGFDGREFVSRTPALFPSETPYTFIYFQPPENAIFNTFESDAEFETISKDPRYAIRMLPTAVFEKMRTIEVTPAEEKDDAHSTEFHPVLKRHPFLSDHLPKEILIPADDKAEKISLITWNLCDFTRRNGFNIHTLDPAANLEKREKRIKNSILAMIEERDPDMICLQEISILNDSPGKTSEFTLGLQKRGYGFSSSKDNRILYKINKFDLIPETKSDLSQDYSTQKAAFKFKERTIIINNINIANIPGTLTSLVQTENLVRDGLNADVTSKEHPHPLSIFIGYFNFNVVAARVKTEKNQILFGNKQDRGDYAFSDGAFYRDSSYALSAHRINQAREYYDLDPETGDRVTPIVSDAILEKHAQTLNAQHRVLNCGYQYDKTLEQFLLDTLEENHIEFIRTANGLNHQELTLQLKESKGEKIDNSLMKALLLNAAQEGQPTKLSASKESVIIPIDKQYYLATFLSTYRKTQAFEYIYDNISGQYKQSSLYQKLKAKKASFYAKCRAEGTSPFHKETEIKKHIAKEKKGKAAISYGLVNTFYQTNYKESQLLNDQIKTHIDGKFSKKKNKI